MASGDNHARRLAVFTGLITALAVTLVGCVYLGHLLDERYRTDPWLTLVGLLVGAGAACFELFRLLGRDQE
jgi:F0F1-type ATP synthase assembly protein I